jgi:hypothetical protein
MKASLFAALLSLGVCTALGQTVKQGGTGVADPNEFTSPMVIETVFAPADQTRWVSDDWTPEDPLRWKHGAFTVPEYHALGRFYCDGIPIRRNYRKRRGTWDSGLSMKVTPVGGGKEEVTVYATIENSGLIHDKIVTLLLEVLSGEERLAVAKVVIQSSTSWKHSTSDDGGKATMVLASDRLKDTKLRITMTTKDY